MKRIALILAVLALAACGVDGEPQAPTKKNGVWFSGDAYIGIETRL